MSRNNKIALLFFSRNAKEESRKKTWFASANRQGNTAVASALIDQSSDFLKNAGLPVFHFHEGNQRGKNFGERFANAYQDVFDRGYSGVIAIGNDSPEIVNIDLQKVSRDLLSGKTVLGASIRGGTYLIGLTRESFDKSEFQNLPWQSGRLFSALRELIGKDQSPNILETLRDINSLNDLKILLKDCSFQYVFKHLISLLKSHSNRFYRIMNESTPDSFLLTNSRFRGPPTVGLAFA
ncbi:DUF2064 domain-containing protein [Cryomorpha ignava]|uniref:DUF2064 domain-containing protein n=1 Tax=Cryomorpha ignava TaxID=101383 RepID=A0A7K3WPX9_9FLAO|nr:DUF2064 domain-containing protein [Cryomorpha ignava]NEN23544.1 DUF2064 domain-containing protein [Cryomorpha ignava]